MRGSSTLQAAAEQLLTPKVMEIQLVLQEGCGRDASAVQRVSVHSEHRLQEKL